MMAFFKRGKKTRKSGPNAPERDGFDRKTPVSDSGETSIERVGVVSGVLSTAAAAQGESPFADVVSRRFGPTGSDDLESRVLPPQRESIADGAITAEAKPVSSDSQNPHTAAPRRDHLRAVESHFSGPAASSQLEVESVAHVGRAMTITGDVVAEQDLEIQGTIEGAVRLRNHQVIVGNEGHVKASVEANVVVVYGKITGNVIASDLVEVEKGGIVGGDIKAPRVIMHDGAIVVGGLDMSASLQKSTGLRKALHRYDGVSDIPHLHTVEPSIYDVREGDDA
jgi:cytoskeletal protein CcmA (bactofilin family)